MSLNVIRAIEIELRNGESVGDQPESGFFDTQIRYSANPLMGEGVAYNYNHIITVSSINQSTSFDNSGNICNSEGITIKLNNVEGLIKRIKGKNINLLNCIVRAIDFVGSDTNSYIEKEIIFTGQIEKIAYSETVLNLKVSSNTNLRKSNLMKTINDVDIPVTFGASSPLDSRFFKAIRLNSDENILHQRDIAAGGTPGIHFFPEAMSIFPVVSNEGLLIPSIKVYDIYLGYMSSTALPNGSKFIDKFIQVRDGKGKEQWAKIKACEVLQTGMDAKIRITLYDYLETNLFGNETTEYTLSEELVNSYVSFYDIDALFQIDSSFCLGWFDDNGNELLRKVELYTKGNDNLPKKIPDFICDPLLSDPTNTSLILNATFSTNSIDSASSFLFYPVKEFGLCTSTNLTDWGFSSYNKRQDGVYDGSLLNPNGVHTVNTTGNNLFDGSLDTSCYILTNFPVAAGFSHLLHAFTFKLPAIPKNFDFSGIYLGINAEIENGVANSEGLKVFKRKFYGTPESVTNVTAENPGTSSLYWDNIGDFYIDRNLENIQFFTNGQDGSHVGKYNLIDLNIANPEKYDQVYEILIVFLKSAVTTASQNYNTKINELFLMFKSDASISNGIYC